MIKMDNKFSLVLTCLLALLVFSGIAYAIGRTTVPSDWGDECVGGADCEPGEFCDRGECEERDGEENVTEVNETELIDNVTEGNETEVELENVTVDTVKNKTRGREIDCDNITSRRERIKCRLQNVEEDDGEIDYDKRTPEACRSIRNPVACVALYKNVQKRQCYEQNATEKDECFRNVTGFKKQERNETSAREYLVLLLYELQERIEIANEDGNVSDDDAANIIELIVEIKQDILNGEKKNVILPKFQELRDLIREVRG